MFGLMRRCCAARRHLICDRVAVRRRGRTCRRAHARSWLTTFGIAPTGPETGYGYLEMGEALAVATPSVPGAHREAPLADAMRYAADSRYVWNSACSASRRPRCGGLERHAADLLDAVRAVWEPLRGHLHDTMLEIDPALFAPVPMSPSTSR